jgi:hypothetical protein
MQVARHQQLLHQEVVVVAVVSVEMAMQQISEEAQVAQALPVP